jgi:ribosome-binding protein aMBF1 (putative translation factor)
MTAVCNSSLPQLVSKFCAKRRRGIKSINEGGQMSSERPMPEPAQALASVIADARRSGGLTAAALAARAGIDPSAYEAIESGEHELSLETIVRVTGALGLSAAELFERAGL